MELVPLLRLVWRRKLILGIGFMVAVAAAIGIGAGPPAASEVAWTRVALDTPKSELLQSAPSGADTLAWRASLLVHLMGTDAVGRDLAQRLHVRPYEVAVMDTELSVPQAPASMPVRAATAASTTAAPYVLTVEVPDPTLPLISIEAAAPTRDGAVRLAAASSAWLTAQSSLTDSPYSSMILTGGGTALKRQRFLVQQVAPIRVKRLTQRQVPMKPIAAAVLILALSWTAALLGPRVLPRRPRMARAV
jgi:hypothetical protein